MNNKYSPPNNNEILDEKEYFNLKLFFNVLKRNKKSIAIISIIGFIVSCIYALSLKRIWQGNFQIVVEKKENSLMNNLNVNSNLLNLAGVNQENQLKTELEILNSPSVLLEVFEYVKKEKLKKGNKSFEKKRFNDWREDYTIIDLVKDTSVLDLKYKDKDKDLILPVLNKISAKYQEYSGARRSREIELGLDFLSNQIDSYKLKSIDSLTKLQNYSETYDLGAPVILEKEKNKIIKIDIELNRTKAEQEIRLINEKLNLMEELNNPQDIIYFGNTLSLTIGRGENNIANTLNTIKGIDYALAKNSLIYTEKDKVIQNLIKDKKLMTGLLETQIKGFLNAKRRDAIVLLETSKRPEGVLVKYRTLLSTATRDEVILDDLENQYRALQLEKARSQDPWELITKPTLLPKPVAPSRKSIALYGLVAFFILGYSRSYILEQKKDIIFSPDEIEVDMNLKLIAELFIKNKDNWGETFNIITNGISKDTSGTIGILPVREMDNESNAQIKSILNQTQKNPKIKFCDSLQEAFKFDNLILLVQIKNTKKKDIFEINKKLIFHKKNNLGTLVLIN